MKFSPIGHQLAVCSEGGKVRLFNPETRLLLTSKKLVEKEILASDYLPNGQQLALGTFRSIALWDLQSDEPSFELKVPRSSMDFYGDRVTIAYSPCGQFLASSSVDHIVHVWHLHSSIIQREHRELGLRSCASCVFCASHKPVMESSYPDRVHHSQR